MLKIDQLSMGASGGDSQISSFPISINPRAIEVKENIATLPCLEIVQCEGLARPWLNVYGKL